jgi:arginine/lysine/histidine transporter system substrate-binding protein
MNLSRRNFCTTMAAGLAMGMVAGSGLAFAADEKTESTETAEFTTVEEGKLIMGTNAAFPPYEYYDGKTIIGIDAEVAGLIADKLGLELDIQDMDFGSIITAVQTGKIDMGMAGMTVTDERKKNVNFTDSYATGIQSIIVPEDSAITGPDDLASNTDYLIGVQENTTGHIYATDDYGEDRVIAYTNGATAVQALTSGKVDCVIIDNEPAKNFVEANEGLKILDTAYVEENYAICISKDNDALLDAVNGALKELIDDGSVQKILDKYINDGTESSDSASDASYKDGEYTASSKGIGGDVPVTVTIEGGKITKVEVGDNSETEGIGSKAIEQLPDQIVAANGTDGVDALAGASVTSKAIFTAVNDCLDQAKA